MVLKKYKPQINQKSDNTYKIVEDNVQIKVILFFEYGEKDKKEIKKFISRIFVDFNVNTFLNENDFKLEWINTG